MECQDSISQLEELTEIDDALIGGRQTGENVLGLLSFSNFQALTRKRYRNL